MGTSGAYGGTPGWNDSRDDTRDWLDAEPSSPISGDEGSDPDNDDIREDGDIGDNEADPEEMIPIREPGEIDPAIARMLAGIAGRLASTIAAGSGGRSGDLRGGSASRAGGGRAGAASSGATAIAGAYGLLSGNADALGDAGLRMDELEGLSPFEQARRIVEAASRTSALIEDGEIREVNANFVWWALQQEGEASPIKLLKRWIIELVFRTWLTETGSVLRDGKRRGVDPHLREQEAMATLEVAANRIDLSIDGVRATDFQRAIIELLGMLNRIFQEAAA